jgi:hypothetical protein
MKVKNSILQKNCKSDSYSVISFVIVLDADTDKSLVFSGIC